MKFLSTCFNEYILNNVIFAFDLKLINIHFFENKRIVKSSFCQKLKKFSTILIIVLIVKLMS